MKNTAQLLQKAVAYHQSGRLKDAEQAYRQLLNADAHHADALRLLGALYLQARQLQSAADYLEKAVHLLPRHPENLTNYAIALRGLGRPHDAIAHYRRALEIEPDYIAALANLAGLYQETGRTADALALHDRILQLQPDHAPAHFNTGNCLLAMGRLAEAGQRYEYALKLKPDYIEAMINLGMALGYAGKGDQGTKYLHSAQIWFEKALQADPRNAVALNNLGNVLRQQGKPEEAIARFRKALEIRPDYTEAAINIATSLRDMNRLEEAIESCRMALRLQPESANARINLGVMLQDLMLHEEAAQIFAEALRRKPASLDAKWNRALSLLALGRYQEGWELHESGLGVPHMRGDYPSPEKRWNGQDIRGKKLLLWCEQGFGDTLQFIRYAEMCKATGAEVILLCPRSLRRLLSHSPFIDRLPENVEERDFDCHAPLMSLPYIFDTRLETIPAPVPYLFIGDDTRAKWAAKFAGASGFKIGLVWAGNPREKQLNAHMADKRRSMDLRQLLPLFTLPYPQFYNLQIGAKVAQIAALGLSNRITDFMGEVEDFEDTAGLIENLDLVISVDTSVVHLAGGLGKPVWVLSRFDACWRWLQNREDSPWYPSARIFGQRKLGDWDEVVARVKIELEKTGTGE